MKNNIENQQHNMDTDNINSELKNLLAKFLPQEKANIVIQSFLVGAGDLTAQNVYLLFISLHFKIRPSVASQFLRSCFTSLDSDYKKLIISQAYEQHREIMTTTLQTEKYGSLGRQGKIKRGNFQYLESLILSNLTIIENDNTAFTNYTDVEKDAIGQIAFDVSTEQSETVLQLREFCESKGMYNYLDWHKKQ